MDYFGVCVLASLLRLERKSLYLDAAIGIYLFLFICPSSPSLHLSLSICLLLSARVQY